MNRIGYHRHTTEGKAMPNRCSFCDTSRIPTNHLILGKEWLEFCQPCGEKETLHRADGTETKTVREVFDSLAEERTQECLSI